MKIVYLITRMDEYGGAQIHIRDLCQWMQGEGHDVAVISGRPGRVSKDLMALGIEYHEIPDLDRPINILKDWKSYKHLKEKLRSIRPDIVSCHSSKAGLLGRLAAHSLGIKVIFTAHGWSFTTGIPRIKKTVYKYFEKFGALFGNHIITVSHFDRDLALEGKIDAPENVTCIHNGMPWLAEVNKEKSVIPQLVMVARFSPQKDHFTLLNALGKIQDKPWHLHLIGKGDDTTVKTQATQAGIVDRITFHGERYDIPDLLPTLDVFLLISHWEGFPRSILEAMRAGLPVITTDTAGSPESVSDGETGYVVEEHDPVALAEKIQTLLEDVELRQAMGKAGRKRYEEEFTFDTMAVKTLKVYESVTGRAPQERQASQEQPLRKFG